MTIRRYMVIMLSVLLLVGVPISAQDAPADPPTEPDTTTQTTVDVEAVSYDEVNDVAARMYCPICEMEPLHTCRAQTCIDWREVIRERLAVGETEDEIIDYFVAEYGERVVGIPEDEGLRLFSFAGPLVGFIIALGVAFFTFQRWQQQNTLVADATTSQPIETTSIDTTDDDTDYRNRLESDLQY